MKKQVIIIIILIGIIIIGIYNCHNKDYVTILKYSEDSSKILVSPDSITINPHFYVENHTTLNAVIDFESLKDSLFILDLKVFVYSSSNPKQPIIPKSLSAIIHPVKSNKDGSLEKLDVNSFNDLPASCKMITNSGLPYNKISFYFKASKIDKTSSYNFKINGRLMYHGKIFYFEKDIKTEPKVEYRPYRMMN